MRPRLRLTRTGLAFGCIAAAAFAFVYPLDAQDPSRLGLTESLVLRGSLTIDPYRSETGDEAEYGSHWYSDKAPGMSLLAVPLAAGAYGAIRAVGRLPSRPETRGLWNRLILLYAARLATGGVVFLASLLLLWRVGELLQPRTGVAVAAMFGVATLAFPLAATTFGHLAGGLLEFGALIAAWRGRGRHVMCAVTGFLAGLGVLFEYQAALAGAVVFTYLVSRTRQMRSAALFVVGTLPPAIALATYNWAAFHSPLHFSYSYVAIPEQKAGLFGISGPTWHGLDKLLLSDHGIARDEPILLLAAAGLVLLWRRGFRAEAAACGAVVVAFSFVTAGYFDPYGGVSPGPRFFVPALPFLAFGLAGAVGRWPYLTTGVAAFSAWRMVRAAASWNPGPHWPTVWTHLGLPTAGTVILVAVPVGAALGFGLLDAIRPHRRARLPHRGEAS